ncbi:MAG TPA: MotA/TolQ/ExbB proton channel family protein [Burkholderiales bacterium]
MFAILQAAGWPIWFLLAASIIAVALIIERSISLRTKKIIPPKLFDRVVEVYRRQGVSDEVIERLAKDSPLGAVLAAGLRNHKSSRYVMKEAIEEAGRAVTHDLERFLTTLGTIATAAPLLGLFGTVIGMIEIFGSQSPTGSNPQQLAHGISIALYNTAFGIAIAIPSLIFYRHYKNKVDTLIVEMELLAAKLVDILHGERTDYPPMRA